MSDSDVPKLEDQKFDVLLLGTSLCNTLLASALARTGKKVIHTDANAFYGGTLCTFNLTELNAFLQTLPSSHADAKEAKALTQEELAALRETCGDRDGQFAYVPWDSSQCVSSYAQGSIYSPLPPPSAEEVAATTRRAFSPVPESSAAIQRLPTQLSKVAREFSLDTSAHLLYARGPLVELLASTSVSRYLEFKPLDASFVMTEGSFTKVPISKSDVFQCSFISMGEKRQLMKLLSAVMQDPARSPGDQEKDDKELKEFSARPFVEWLRSRKLSGKLLDFVLYSIAQVDANQEQKGHQISTAEGIDRMRMFTSSLGRYSEGAFLTCMYGSGELPQAFTRSCAVQGGVYILRFPIKALVYADAERKTLKGVVSAANQFITADYLSADPDYFPQLVQPKLERVSRALCITDSPLRNERSSTAGMSLITIPPNTCRNPHPIRILQFNEVALPHGKVILYISTVQNVSPEADLRPIIDMLLDTTPRQNPPPPPPVTSPLASAASSAAQSPSDSQAPTQTPATAPASASASSVAVASDPVASSADASAVPAVATESPATRTAPTAQTEVKQPPSAKPNLLWAGFYSQRIRTCSRPTTANLTVFSDQPYSISLESAIVTARAEFDRVCPGVVFHAPLPAEEKKAQDVDELSDDEDEAKDKRPAAASAAAVDPETDPELAAVLALSAAEAAEAEAKAKAAAQSPTPARSATSSAAASAAQPPQADKTS